MKISPVLINKRYFNFNKIDKFNINKKENQKSDIKPFFSYGKSYYTLNFKGENQDEKFKNHCVELAKIIKGNYRAIDSSLRQSEIIQIAKLDDKSYEKCISLLKNDVSYDAVRLIATLDDEKYEQALCLIEKEIDAYEVPQILNLDDKQKQKAETLIKKGLKQNIVSTACNDEKVFNRTCKMLDLGAKNATKIDMIAKFGNDGFFNNVVELLKRNVSIDEAWDATRHNPAKIIALIDEGINVSDAIVLSHYDDEELDVFVPLVKNGLPSQIAVQFFEYDKEGVSLPVINSLAKFAKNINGVGLKDDSGMELFSSIDVARIKDFEKLEKWVDSVNYEQLLNFAPEIQKFSSAQLFTFIKHNLNKDFSDIDKSSLIFRKDFKKYIQENYLSIEDMNKILTKYPATNRNIGELPEGWCGNKKNNKKIFEDVCNLFASYSQTGVKYSKKNEVCDELAKDLSCILNKNVTIELCGSGAYGIVYRIQVDGCNDVCLKYFLHDYSFSPIIHGGHYEPQMAFFANAHSSEFVKAFFARVGHKNQDDTFLVTQYLDNNIAPIETGENDGKYEILSQDVSATHNLKRGKIFDFGGAYVLKSKN